jgi:hypothetical protein
MAVDEERNRLALQVALGEAGLKDMVVPGLWVDDDKAVAVATTGGGAFVGWLDVAWPSPARPEWQLRDVVHLRPFDVEQGLDPALADARAKRATALRQCRFCGERHLPGHMHSEDVCQDCAEKHLGVVH